MKAPYQQLLSPAEFRELTDVAVGLPVSHTWRGYGSAIFLELGRLRRPDPSSSATNRPPEPHPRGEVEVMIQWSWRIERPRSIAVGSWSTDARITGGVAALRDARVTSISVEGRLPELVLGLSGGRWLRSFMTSNGQPAWTVFLPDESWLTVAHGCIIHDSQNQRRRRK